MKKVLVGFAAIALIMTSCAQNEVTEKNSNPNVVGFDLSTGKTRATTTDLTALKADANGFGVFATNPSGTFIDNAAYKFDGTWRWAVDEIMWPTTESGFPISFYAYHPKASATLTSALTQNYTVAATTATQIDYLAANQVNVVVRPASSNIALNFKHILSKIDFKVVTGTAVTVEVQSIAIKNVGNKGTFNFANLSWSVAPNTFTSSYPYMSAPVTAANTFAGQTSGANITPASGSMMLMPQNLSGRAWDKLMASISSKSFIEVVYRIYETATGKDIVGLSDASQHPNYATSGNGETKLFVKVAYPLPTNWLMGKAYTYTIYLGTADSSGGNLIDGKFIDEDGNSSNLKVIVDGEDIDPEKPIFTDKAIGFDVSVDDWGPATNSDIK